MLNQNDIDDLRIRADRLISHFHDIPDQLRLAELGQTGSDMAFDERHWNISSLQAGDEVLVGVAFNKFGQVLAVFDEVDASSLADHEEDVVRGLTGSLR
jgi:hypothetical protein